MNMDSSLWAAQVLTSLMTDSEKAAMDLEQKISFVYGNVKLSNPDVTREMVEEIVNKEGK